MNWIIKLSSKQLFANIIIFAKTLGYLIFYRVWCLKHTQVETIEYDKNAISVFKSDDKEMLARHLQ